LGGNICYFCGAWELKEPKISSFLLGKYFGKIEIGQKKCPKTDLPKYFPQNTCFVSIIEIYGLAAKKIIFNL
jgi:hypothetical protein